MAKQQKPQWAYYYDYRKVNPVFAASMLVLLVSVAWMVVDDYRRDWKVLQRAYHDREAAKVQRALEFERAARSLSAPGLAGRLALREKGLEAALRERADVDRKSKEISEKMAPIARETARLAGKETARRLTETEGRTLVMLREQDIPLRKEAADVSRAAAALGEKTAALKAEIDILKAEIQRRRAAVAGLEGKISAAREEIARQEKRAEEARSSAAAAPPDSRLRRALHADEAEASLASRRAELKVLEADLVWERRLAEIGLEPLRRAIDREEESLAAELRDLERKLREDETEETRKVEAFNFRKADYDEARSAAEHHADHRLAHGGDGADEEGPALERRVKEIDGELSRMEDEKKEAEARKAETALRVAERRFGLDRMAAARNRTARAVEDLEKRLDEIGRNWKNAVLSAPGMEFFQRPLQIQQENQSPLTDSYTFADVQKLDRCVTCHKGIDNPANADEPDPLARAHPWSAAAPGSPPGTRPLFVAPNSYHPRERFGCTVCHGGNAKALDFVHTVHTPRGSDPGQKERWEGQYGWRHYHLWDEPMLPMEHVGASCVKCHDEGRFELPLPEGARFMQGYNQGRRLFETYGCFACHKTPGYTAVDEATKMELPLYRVGPSLRHLAAKTRPGWVKAWLMDPRKFRPRTRMPRFFGLENNNDVERNRAEVAAITAYLFAYAEPPPVETSVLPAEAGPADKAQIKRGGVLFKTIGCTACHLADEKEDPKSLAPPHPEKEGRDEFGPDLSRIGVKTTRAWLYRWVQDPKGLNPDSRMPDLRLTPQEAGDLSAWLATLRKKVEEGGGAEGYADADWEPREANVDDLLVEYLKFDPATALTEGQARRRIEGWTKERRLVDLGGRLVRRYGCFACHDIPGMERETPIGAPFAEEGSKFLDQFDFGAHHDLPRDKFSWVMEKLKDPRQFDLGRAEHKRYDETLKMPSFGFADLPDGEERVASLATFVLGHVRARIPADFLHRPAGPPGRGFEGETVIRKYNCRGCHVIEGKGGDIVKDKGFVQALGQIKGVIGSKQEWAPPGLAGEGRKVQHRWLFDFLKDPHPIRGFVKTRMPTFGMSDEEATKLVAYFAARAGEPYPFRADAPAPSPEAVAAGRAFAAVQVLNCYNCHGRGEVPPVEKNWAAEPAPDLLKVAERLTPGWTREWIENPSEALKRQGGWAKTSSMLQFFEHPDDPKEDRFKEAPDLLEAARPVLGDRMKATSAIRDYLWWIHTHPQDALPAGP